MACRVWQHVTEALKQGQESIAADAKHEVSLCTRMMPNVHSLWSCCHLCLQVEEKQREGVKARKEAGIEWKQKVCGSLWVKRCYTCWSWVGYVTLVHLGLWSVLHCTLPVGPFECLAILVLLVHLVSHGPAKMG